MNLTEIRSRLAELKPEILELSEKDEATEDEVRSLEEKLTEFETLTAEATPLEERAQKIDAVRAAVVEGKATRTEGDGTRRDPIPGIHTGNPTDLNEIRSLINDPKQNFTELRERALDVIENIDKRGEVLTDEQREAASRLASTRRDNAGAVAKHILLTGSDEYRGAFEKVLRDPTSGAAYWSPEERTAMQEARTALSLSSANGGYLLPFLLDPTIITTNSGATNPMRAIADVRTVDQNVWHGVSSAGVTAEWIAEATEVADASPTFAQPTITCAKADAYIQASWEVIADSGISSELGALIADAKDRLEATAFVVGTGSGQPRGVVTGTSGTGPLVAGSSGAAGAADFVVGDVYKLQNALPPRYRQNSSWLAEQTVYNSIRQFATGSGPQHAFWADLGVAIPPLLLGRPAYESSAMDNTVVSGSNDDVLLIGDFKVGYKIIDRIGVTMLFEPIVLGSSRRPTGESGWVAYWRVGGDTVNSGAFRLLRL